MKIPDNNYFWSLVKRFLHLGHTDDMFKPLLVWGTAKITTPYNRWFLAKYFQLRRPNLFDHIKAVRTIYFYFIHKYCCFPLIFWFILTLLALLHFIRTCMYVCMHAWLSALIYFIISFGLFRHAKRTTLITYYNTTSYPTACLFSW